LLLEHVWKIKMKFKNLNEWEKEERSFDDDLYRLGRLLWFILTLWFA